MAENSITINKTKIKENYGKSVNFFKQKKVLNIILIIFLLVILIGGSWVRLQNLELLKDSTTGEYMPLALDPFYFLRVAETIVNEGGLPAFDNMRYPFLQVEFSNEILPQVLTFMYKIGHGFDNTITIQFIDVIYPVIFFALGLVAFFFLILILTKSKITAAISSFLLAIIPAYLYRTMAGFADHEALGMFFAFLAFLCYGLAIKFLEKNDKSNRKTILWGALAGFVSAFTILSWGGIANFVFLIIPLSFGIIWLIKSKTNLENSKNILKKYLIFYFVWFISSILFSVLFGYSFSSIISRFVLSSSGVIGPALLLFIIIDYLLISKGKKIIKKNFEKYRIFYSAIITLILGFIFLLFAGQNIFLIISQIFSRFLTPANLGRTGLTVAENAAPYLTTWISQIGKTFFWIFFGGAVFVGFALAEGIRKKSNKILFSILWLIMISGILFSRISTSSLLNGTSFLSKSIYFIGIALFLIYLVFLYFRDEIKIKNELIFIAAWLFVTLITVRGSVRFFFVITPLFCFMAGYFVVRLFNYAKKSKDDLLKMILWVLLGLAILGLIISSVAFWNASSQQGKYTSPSANLQWQNTMEWVRENTQQGEIFVHWWDYGYWVEYLGQRPSLTDGGHANGFWDHLIGRYVLTTPFPETAFSFMKTHEVSYLLIDPTDIGKYPAYSKIGSDEQGDDRYSWISTMLVNPSQTTETKDGIIRFYPGGQAVDQDIIYQTNEGEVFLPANKAGLAGVLLETSGKTIKQPGGIFVYNQKQINIPLRYLYYKGEILDFGGGLNALIYVFPKVDQTSTGSANVDENGALMYFSPKNMNSLFVQNYILDNSLGGYENLQLVYTGSDPVVDSLNSQGQFLGEFVFFQGLRGPIKIWKVSYSEDIQIVEEFLSEEGDYAEFDNLQFTK